MLILRSNNENELKASLRAGSLYLPFDPHFVPLEKLPRCQDCRHPLYSPRDDSFHRLGGNYYTQP